MSGRPAGRRDAPESEDRSEDLIKLVRARRLLTATLDERRAIVGEISRHWISAEIEREIPLDQIPPRLLEDEAVVPQGPEGLPDTINTNRLPKLEPALNANILVGAILYGARLYGEGTPDPATGVRCSEIGNDLIVAAMVHDTLGLPDHQSALHPDRHRVVDEEYLAELLGDSVVTEVARLRDGLARFDAAFARGTLDEFRVSMPVANAIAAIKAATLRLTARAAGDGVFALLDADQLEELRRAGIDPSPAGADFPERPLLERDWRIARAAVNLEGVDRYTVRTPIEGQLLLSVENVLERGLPVQQLVGRYGAALRHFHMVLPMMERYSTVNRKTVQAADGKTIETEGPYALGTLHVTGLEVTRYLSRVRRKGNGSGAGHSLLVAAAAAEFLGSDRGVPAVAGSDCHDVVEDGGQDVSGFDQTLELFATKFGSPLAALVAEVTDSITRADGPAKAAAFLAHSYIPFPEDLYNVGQLEELRAVATNPHVPYTAIGVLMKAVDTGITQLEGIQDPDLMRGPWRHSGARVNWDQRSRGNILRPLLQRIVIEIELSVSDPFYHRREHALSATMILRFREMLHWSFEIAEQYMVQNLKILADEYQLDRTAFRELVEIFPSPGRSREEFGAWLDERLDDAHLDDEVRRRGLAATYRRGRGGIVERDTERLLDYRDSALWRRAARQAIQVPEPDPSMLAEVVRVYESRMGQRTV